MSDQRLSSVLRGHLYVSGAQGAWDAAQIEAHKIGAVINLSGMDNAFPELGISYLRLNISDEAESDIAVVFDQTSDFIANSGVPTLVHCQMGCSRAPTVAIAYLMRHKGLQLSKAYNLVLNSRPIIEPNPGFWKQLERYECKIFKLKESTLPLIDFLGDYMKTEFEDEFDDNLWEAAYEEVISTSSTPERWEFICEYQKKLDNAGKAPRSDSPSEDSSDEDQAAPQTAVEAAAQLYAQCGIISDRGTDGEPLRKKVKP